MEILCVTGVEDKLQVDVTDSIESLRNAGIQIWMLSGDKVETATCIAISTGQKGKGARLRFAFRKRNASTPGICDASMSHFYIKRFFFKQQF